MTKKVATKKTPEITFEVRLIGPGIEPDLIPPRAMFDAIAAIQDIASGRDPFETSTVPEGKQISLVDVKKGSAVYCCRARDPKSALSNLGRIGKLLASD